MGYGQKYDFTRLNPENPAPNKYNLDCITLCYQSKKKKKITFGESRDKCKNIGERD